MGYCSTVSGAGCYDIGQYYRNVSASNQAWAYCALGTVDLLAFSSIMWDYSGIVAQGEVYGPTVWSSQGSFHAEADDYEYCDGTSVMIGYQSLSC